MGEGEVEEVDLNDVERDFSFLKGEVSAILLFGSHAEGLPHGRSDVDVCLVAPDTKPSEIMSQVWRNLNLERKGYDVWVFEELGPKMKHSVVEGHEVVWRDPDFRLQEYFYFWEKIWRDQAVARGVT